MIRANKKNVVCNFEKLIFEYYPQVVTQIQSHDIINCLFDMGGEKKGLCNLLKFYIGILKEFMQQIMLPLVLEFEMGK